MSDLSSGAIKVVTEVPCVRCLLLRCPGCPWCGGTGLDYETTALVEATGLIETFIDEDERDTLVAESRKEEE